MELHMGVGKSYLRKLFTTHITTSKQLFRVGSPPPPAPYTDAHQSISWKGR